MNPNSTPEQLIDMYLNLYAMDKTMETYSLIQRMEKDMKRIQAELCTGKFMDKKYGDKHKTQPFRI